MAVKLVPVECLDLFCSRVLQNAGMNPSDAAIVTESLLFADLRGIDSHGLIRLSTYLERVRMGVMELNADTKTVCDYPASAVIDARNGFGQIAGVKAIQIAMEKARECGLGSVGIKNSNHFGVAAFFAMKALTANFIGLAITNASPAIAPYGAKTALLGTNPIAVAIPARRQRPVVLDMASSVVARGKIRLALLAGERIPPHWALDDQGQPTEDPKSALKGTMTPVGGPKGAGLSLIIDLLSGVLTGSSLTGDVRNITDNSGPSKTGHLMIAFDPSKFTDAEQFRSDVDEAIVRIKAMPSVNVGPIYLPGEIEAILEEKRRAEGIPLDEELQLNFSKLAAHYGEPEPWTMSAFSKRGAG
jgi:LDH2 family malate/lactate/ureidoglycolate dehydrogenase